jgi:hypothetical protein
LPKDLQLTEKRVDLIKDKAITSLRSIQEKQWNKVLLTVCLSSR